MLSFTVWTMEAINVYNCTSIFTWLRSALHVGETSPRLHCPLPISNPLFASGVSFSATLVLCRCGSASPFDADFHNKVIGAGLLKPRLTKNFHVVVFYRQIINMLFYFKTYKYF